MTNEHDSALVEATSLRATGEVYGRKPVSCVCNSNAREEPTGVVGGSMSGKEGACKSRRSGGIGRAQARSSEVRAAIVVKKRGNARGAKCGRKVNDRSVCKTKTN